MNTLPYPNATPLRQALDEVFDQAFFSGGLEDRSLEKALPIPDVVFENLPPLLARAVSTAPQPEGRPILTASVYALLSACLPNVRSQYAGRWYGAPLLTALIAPPGSYKGLAVYAADMCRELDGALEELNRDKLADENEGGSGAEPVQAHGLLLPADASSAGLLEAVARSHWPVALMETEIDSVVGHASQDWRQLSPLLRKAAEHERLSVIRKGYGLMIERPMVAALLAGTPDQFVRLIPSASDGLFSRFFWLWTPNLDDWRSPRPQPDRPHPDVVLSECGNELCEIHAALLHRASLLDFRLPEAHWDILDAVGQGLKERARDVGYGASVDSLVHRNGILALRLAMITEAFLRKDTIVEKGDDLASFTASDTAFSIGLLLALVGLDHGLRLHGLLPAMPVGPASRNGDLFRLFEALPGKFQRRDAVAVGDQLGYAQRTVDKYLRLLCEQNLLTHEKHGSYLKKGHEEKSGFVQWI